MSAAVWAIGYSVERSTAEYLTWFHQVHIPEKLSRPGYTWAAHYESVEQPGRYLALFGADTATTFLAPTPAQLKARQDSLTRQMSGLRSAPWSGVFLEAMRAEGPAPSRGAPGEALRFATAELADSAAEDGFCGWAAAEWLPRLAANPGVVRAALLVGVIGRPRHALLEGYTSAELVQESPRAGAAFVGRRLA